MSSTNEKSIKLIAAVSDNDVIGLENGELPWVLKSDLKRFRELTIGNTVVMGCHTWKSIGERPLPNRMNIILSRKKRILPRSKWVKQIHSPMEVFMLPKNKRPGDLFIIGGGQVYSAYLPIVQEMYLTYVHLNIPNEEKCVKFPKVHWGQWRLFENTDHNDKEYYENGINYEYRHYVRT